MRLAYFLAAVIATTLHVSSSALLTEKRPNQLTLENVKSPGVVETTNPDGERLLRRVSNADADEAKVDKEERSLKNWLSKQVPFTKGWKQARETEKVKKAAKAKQKRLNKMRHAQGKPEIYRA
ncbi:secreted RxLR effector peptide protein, putative [Phytophthora infestans T30-4]|uniref:RxLR effector protein n=2 Tax=Phytophthora infestans TaxID=4787 RepID=D0NM90_PHYIT|nr:secreted RxLR effector peptide protein, putative [Phytophthora infestans T30-4]EEY60811.1 secreted RxLR effector peptide protein, putative [Phytophthora infestans T30-4]KAF4031984.1 RXLR domain-containing protein [Phytophthora infestans]KAF4128153.1 RXLR effector domain-containing protein [Phytophthora infestans]|eukprot:XP_002899757.1 secreted RxLR effector peptide protein, putative [Phytophthora infestans T30-4]